MSGLADSLIARLIKLTHAMDDHCQTISGCVTSRDHNVSVANISPPHAPTPTSTPNPLVRHNIQARTTLTSL